ncbi:hypothetical protein GGX14DRAFT_625091 [Mycena pura]|uniref:FAD linked oxidase N-terminal domain-containing protein n=1 Tax=Mycena pura TaxID=153505 RepID=A0AAD6VIV6_9AGAR|nr:hypothetical protein GGX14DRAFT_625091 [Mycena pura]
MSTAATGEHPGVIGKQFGPTDKDYDRAHLQYATSTHRVDHGMNPGLVVQPRSKDDIKKVIAYAKANKKAIAIRTGGHQYSGASSTGPHNIQLDLKNTFESSEDLSFVSHSLDKFNAFLRKHKVFVPHGQCSTVHLGGHVQTGGYGQLGRSFGLLGDHKKITRSSDPDLFFAWLGGSPGNLGVLTHFSIQVHRDDDHRGSIGLYATHLYNKDKLRKLVGHLAEMSDNENFPRNYDVCISVVSSSLKLFSSLELLPVGGLESLDEKVKEEHPEIFDDDGNLVKIWPRLIVVYAQYVPFGPNDKPDMAFLEQFKKGSIPLRRLTTQVKAPMSQLTKLWIFPHAREFEYPYIKRTYLTNSKTLRVEKIMPSGNGQWLSAQLQCFGGENSMFTRNANNGTAYSWRDSTLCMTIDNFHKPEKKAEAEAWQATNDAEAIGPNGIFSKQDRRVLWGSYGSFDLDSVWNTYYEDRPKYERLMQTRTLADPEGIFTPNTFCVKRARDSVRKNPPGHRKI